MSSQEKLPTRTANRIKRNERIKVRVNELHEVKRMRIDDVFEQVAEELCISISTLKKALKGK
jgi:hypothetical protein